MKFLPMLFSKPDFLKSPLEHFRGNIEQIFDTNVQIFREKSVKKGLPFVYTLVIQEQQQPLLTSISYGASFAIAPEQKNKVELLLQMETDDMAWAHVIGYLANHLRGDCPFHEGEIIRFGQKISQESKLNSFVVCKPDMEELQGSIMDSRKSSSVYLMQLLPIYEEEVLSIAKYGLKGFIDRLQDKKTDPKRKPI